MTSRTLWYAAVFPGLAAAALYRCARQAQRYTAFVSIEAPDALLLEIQGSLRLFGTLERLQACIDAGWEELGVMAHGASAPSTLAALWLARAGERARIEHPAALAGRLAGLPIGCTAWDADRLQTLRSFGVAHIGELLRLPRAGIARRLGPAALLDLDIALAKAPAPRRAFVPRERFRERCDFETEIDAAAALEQALAAPLERCARFLRERRAGVQALALTLRHRAAPPTRLRAGLASITGEHRRLRDVLAQRLLRLELAAPVRALELLSAPLQALPADSLGLFGGFGDQGAGEGAAQLVERLRARLGERAVYGVSSIAEHRPERAWRRVQELRLCRTAASAPASAPGTDDALLQRPVWLLAEPVPWSARASPAPPREGWVLEQGPERIESGWWDGEGVARDYYVARRAHGARLWVFQERRSRRWYLHGVFA
ncbi:MAG TPA: DNA polymerase Y family protein [Steroidobacteraceae bacterium]|nr:DNA polymerase Y family protein [Steroidobacteraceae bacterium]